MNNRVQQIIEQITALEQELHAAIEAQESRLSYRLEQERVVFENAVELAHQRLKKGIFSWFLDVRPQNFLTAPIIYGMIVPLTFFDLCVTFYQWSCFPIYGIRRVRRRDYFVMDHQHLAYLNAIEKLDCLFCSYAVGLLAYSTEITSRTEQYFCPIKHARKLLAAHSRYRKYLPYGDAEAFHERLEKLREDLGHEEE